MKEIFQAEVLVETVYSIESFQNNGTWFRLADYSTMTEFLADCAGWFEEDDPEYIYVDWTDIPDFLIGRRWFCPNFFELRDALQMIDEPFIESFAEWCRHNGHDLAVDDPLLLVTRYQDNICPVYEPDPDTIESEGTTISGIFYGLTGQGSGAMEIFDDNYN